MRILRWVPLGILLFGCGTAPTPAPTVTPFPVIYTPEPKLLTQASPSQAFVTGTITVEIGPGGKFTPDRVYLRPGATTIIVNRDSVPHTFVGFGGATSASGPIPPGGTFTHNWIHPGTWTFHDTLTPNAPTFTATTVPER
jgi:plastocyanin